MSRRDAWVAATRFGLGPRPGDLDDIASDPRGWLVAQLVDDLPLPKLLEALPATENIPAFRQKTAKPMRGVAKAAFKEESKELYKAEERARVETMLSSVHPFRERLVAFWSNHFSVSVERGAVRGLVGAFEREAIRPHVTQRFIRMLRGSTRHPAMQIYLDNHKSTGPNSTLGERRGKGLNENLAREILELHTVGVAHHTQADVEAFARVLTGWGVRRTHSPDEGGFEFDSNRHEPGDKQVLGFWVRGSGVEEGEAMLAHLASEDTTAHHIATKMVRHFVHDDPPPSMVGRLAQVYRDTDGDLRALAVALVEADEPWAMAGSKLRTPFDWVMAAGRAFELPVEEVLHGLRRLGQPTWRTQSPAGWPDTSADWMGPEALLARIDWAARVERRLPSPRQSIVDIAKDLAGPGLSATTLAALKGPEPVTSLLVSPSFQRR